MLTLNQLVRKNRQIKNKKSVASLQKWFNFFRKKKMNVILPQNEIFIYLLLESYLTKILEILISVHFFIYEEIVMKFYNLKDFKTV